MKAYRNKHTHTHTHTEIYTYTHTHTHTAPAKDRRQVLHVLHPSLRGRVSSSYLQTDWYPTVISWCDCIIFSSISSHQLIGQHVYSSVCPHPNHANSDDLCSLYLSTDFDLVHIFTSLSNISQKTNVQRFSPKEKMCLQWNTWNFHWSLPVVCVHCTAARLSK